MILALKKWFLNNLMNIFLTSSQCPEFENIYTLATLNKTYKNHKEMNIAPQSCQDESGLLKVLNTEDKKNEKIVQQIFTTVKKKAMFLKEIT